MPENVILTGYGGLLARDLLPALEAVGYAVTPLSRTELDVVDSGAVSAALDAVQPAAVVNTAAYTDVDGAQRDPAAAERANAAGPEVLARACRTRGVTLLHYSTDFVFDGEAHRPYREDDPARPLGVYGQTKLEGEQRIRAALPDGHLIVRTSWLYGLGGPSFPRTILEAAGQREVLEVVEDQIGCPTWTADLSRASVALLTAGTRGTVHAAAPDHVSRHGWAVALCHEARAHTDLRVREVRESRTVDTPGMARRPRWSVLGCPRLQAALGAPLPSWRERLAPFVRQLVAQRVGAVVALVLVGWLAAGCNGGPLSSPTKVPTIPIPVPVATTPAAPAMQLTIEVDGQGYTVRTPQGPLSNAEGTPGPTVPCKEPGCPTVESYDNAELQRILAEVKVQYPELDSVVVRAGPDVTYEVLILVLDASRANGSTILFPNVALEVDGAP